MYKNLEAKKMHRSQMTQGEKTHMYNGSFHDNGTEYQLV